MLELLEGSVFECCSGHSSSRVECMDLEKLPIVAPPKDGFCVQSAYLLSPLPRVASDNPPLSSVDQISDGSASASTALRRTHAEQVAQVKDLIEACNRRLLEHMSSQLWASRCQSGLVQSCECCEECKDKVGETRGAHDDLEVCHELPSTDIWKAEREDGHTKANGDGPIINVELPDNWRIDYTPRTSRSSPRAGVVHLEPVDPLEMIVTMQRQNIGGNTRTFNSAISGLLPDIGDMKKRVKESIQVGTGFNASDFYHTKGCAQRIARSHVFESVTLFVIVCNALWISIEQDLNDSEVLMEAGIPFQIGEHGFCLYFAAEWLIRYLAFAKKFDIVRDRWFLFDTFLVTAMVCETWVMGTLMYFSGVSSVGGDGLGNLSMIRMVRLLRLTRMARIVRLLRAFPELIMLVKAIGLALRAVFFTIFLLLIITYMFAIVLTQSTQDSEIGARYFDTVPDSMKYMLISSVFPDLADILEDIGFASWLWLIVFLIFLFIISLTLMNMLVGFLVEVVKVIAQVEKEQAITLMFTEEMMLILSDLDSNGNLSLTGSEFTKIFWNAQAVKFLTQMDVDVVALVDHVELLFKGDKSLGYADIITWLLELRGTNHCTVKDVVELRKYILEELRNHSDAIRDLLTKELKTRGQGATPLSRRR